MLFIPQTQLFYHAPLLLLKANAPKWHSIEKEKRESHICCPPRDLRPTTAHPCRRATQTSRRYDNNPTSFRIFFKNESDGIVIPMSIYRCFILGKGLKVVVSSRQEQAQINAFHNMSFPHLPCLLMRLLPDGVRTSVKLQIKFHITSEYA